MNLKIEPKLLSSEEIQRFDPKEREDYIRNIVLDILKKKGRGVTISEIVEETQLNRITVTKHLDILVSIREAYKRQVGNAEVYFKNGKVIHETNLKSQLVGTKTYTFYLLENPNENERMIYIQEKEIDPFMNQKVNGGILINARDISSFMKELKSFCGDVIDGN